MKTSREGAPICTGAGVAAVRKRIEESFDTARQGLANVSPRESPEPRANRKSPASLTTHQRAVAIESRAQRPLSEIVAPVLKIAEGHFKSVVVRNNLGNETFVVVEPKETVSELLTACERAIEELNLPRRKSSRYEIVEES